MTRQGTPAKTQQRRTQEQRTAQTRLALIEAAISVIYEVGYTGATIELIATKAGVSRGAMLHQFGTRAVFMAEIVKHVADDDMNIYEESRRTTGLGNNLYDWPKVLWGVLGKPSGVAVLEILQATRSDPDLAKFVLPMQDAVEERALEAMRGAFGGDRELALTVMRLMVWTARGLSIADRHLPHADMNEAAIGLLARLLQLAAPDGMLPALGSLRD